MVKWVTLGLCLVGWLVLAAGVAAPLAGMVVAALGSPPAADRLVPQEPAAVLLARSLMLAGLATAGAVLLGLWPGAVLGVAAGRATPFAWGLVLTPLLLPPQIHAYAWDLASAPDGPLGWALSSSNTAGPWAGAARAGAICAGWLWPIVAMLVAAAWRSAGRNVYALAILDTTPARAYLRAVLPAVRHHLIAAACLVFAVGMIEYAIPHLTLSRVYATELLMLVEAGAPPSQTLAMAAPVMLIVVALLAGAGWSLRATGSWQPVDPDDATEAAGRHLGAGRLAGAALAAVWIATVGMPVLAMACSLRRLSAWPEALGLFSREWGTSAAVSAGAGLLAVAMAAATVLLWRASDRRWLKWASLAGAVSAVVPPAALGLGFITLFNRPGVPGDLYDRTPAVWCLCLVARYGAIAVLIAWLALGRRTIRTVEQARVDGATGLEVLGYVLLPMLAPSLLAAGLAVMLLSMFEVVATHLVGPIGFPSLAVTLLNHMHYGRDDVVIATSLTVVGVGLLVTLCCGWLLVRPAAGREAGDPP